MQSLITFLNASLLLGAAAFVIPLVIHLLNRSRFKTLNWGAMLFLDDALRANSRRLEWQKWLLLLLRCAIPICLALCMARPLLQSNTMVSNLPGGQSVATCLLIDNSLSMEAKADEPSQKTETFFDLAKRYAIDMIDTSARSSRWAIGALEANADESTEVRSRDLNRQATFIEAMPHGSGGVDFLSSIEEAMTKLAKTTEGRRQIIVMSDFQKSMCQAIEPSQVTAMRRRYDEMPNSPSLVFFPVGETETRKRLRDNLTIRVDSKTRSVVGVDQPWEVRLVVKNFGNELARGVKMILSIDATPISSKTFDIPSRAETQVTFGMTLADARSHRIEATLETNDALAADNQAAWSVLVLGALPVLVVDPTLYDRNGTPESDFLQAALAPFADNLENHSNLFRISRIIPEELTPDKIHSHKIIVLTNVPKLIESAVEPLIEHIQAGGILAIFAGDRIDPAWYNTQLNSASKKLDSETTPTAEQRFLPFLFDSQKSLVKLEDEGIKLRRENFQHPAVSFLNDARAGSLDNVEVRGWYRLLPSSTATEDSATGLLSLVNGDLFLAERTFGDGAVIQCATTCNDRWTNWPLRPIFLPMLQQLLLNTTPPVRWLINVETGQQLNVPSTQVLRWIDEPSIQMPGFSKKPGIFSDDVTSEQRDGETKLVQNEDRSTSMVWQLPNSRHSDSSSIVARYPGIYTIEGIVETPLYLSAQAPLGESDLEAESEAGLQSLADRLGARVVRSTGELRSLDSLGNRELWHWFLIGLLVLLFGELFLQRHLSGVAA